MLSIFSTHSIACTCLDTIALYQALQQIRVYLRVALVTHCGLGYHKCGHGNLKL